MGLTLHYSLAAPTLTAAEARAVVVKLQRRALDLSFIEVSDVFEFKDQGCRRAAGDTDDEHAWLKTQVVRYLSRQLPTGDEIGLEVPPKEVVAFSINPARGSEPANVGLCKYPTKVEVDGWRLPTGLKGWSWSSFCKTQYASNPSLGGVPNFLRCHLGLVSLLDYAKELGVLKGVTDEGEYWQKREVPALIKEIGEWNALLAGAYGSMKDAIEAAGQDPRSLRSAIGEFPNFEHLEAEGRRDQEDD